MADGTLLPSKVCTKCNLDKPIDEFPLYKENYRRGACSDCRKAQNNRWRSRTAAARKANCAIYYQNNREKIRAYTVEWRKNNHDKILSGNREWRKKNPDRDRRNWTNSNRRKRMNPGYRLRESIASQINQGLRGAKNGRGWETLVGYTIGELKRHIERQFARGMSWANYGEWHIDHIVPASSFQYETPDDDEFKRCWALTNLRPMWAPANISKGAKRLYLL